MNREDAPVSWKIYPVINDVVQAHNEDGLFPPSHFYKRAGTIIRGLQKIWRRDKISILIEEHSESFGYDGEETEVVAMIYTAEGTLHMASVDEDWMVTILADADADRVSR